MKLRYFSLFWKIYLTVLVVLVLPMLLFALLDAILDTRLDGKPAGLIRNLDWTADIMVERAEIHIESALKAGDPGPVYKWLREISERSGMELFVVSHGYEFPEPVPKELLEPEPSLSFNPLVDTAVSRSGQTKIYALLYPFGKSTFVRVVARDALVLFIVAIGALMSYLLVNNFMKPLRNLREVTGELGKGNFSARVSETVTSRGDEIGSLGAVFNHMAGDIEQFIESHKRLLSDISHEMRSPLQRMDVALALARKGCRTDACGWLDRVDREIRRLDSMTGELLILARAEAPIELSREIVSLDAILSSVVEDANFEEQANDRCAVADVQDYLTVRGDGTLIERALGNVVRNALKYTADNRPVEVRLYRDGEEAVVTVRDYGPGVGGDELEKIFHPFYRADTFPERQRTGAGLGLTMTRSILEKHKGRIKAANHPEGGLLVTMRLPLYS